MSALRGRAVGALALVAIGGCGDDGAVAVDATTTDAMSADATIDAAVADGGPADAGPTDATELDASLPAMLQIAPAQHDFGIIPEGTQSATVSFEVTNAGGLPSGILASDLGGTHPSDYSIQVSTCQGIALAPGASCMAGVRFTPELGSVGSRLATLEIGGGTTSPAIVELEGHACGSGGISFMPDPHDFGGTQVGATGASQSFVLFNSGCGTTGLLSISRSGDHPDDFTITADACHGMALGYQEMCAIEVTFTPGGLGTRNATLSASAVPGGSATALLTGTGE